MLSDVEKELCPAPLPARGIQMEVHMCRPMKDAHEASENVQDLDEMHHNQISVM